MTKLPYYCEPYGVAFSRKELCEDRKDAAKGIFPKKARRQSMNPLVTPTNYELCKTCKGVE